MRDLMGGLLAPDSEDRQVAWIHYVARKPLDVSEPVFDGRSE